MGAPARALPLVAGVLAGFPATGIYKGFTVREQGGMAASFRIYQGTDASGVLLETVTLAMGESKSAYYPEGLRAGGAGGVFVEITGTVLGSVRMG